MPKDDVVIIGAGLGGLLCAVMLAKEGKKVTVIEQNKQVGGCLQTFSFKKKIFDSCVHYIGAMLPNQIQHRIFEYVNINQHLTIKQLDTNCFDSILLGEDTTAYPHAQGLEYFVEQLIPFFPHKAQALTTYIGILRHIADSFPMYNLRMGSNSEKEKVLYWELQKTLMDICQDSRLVNVLTGNSLLYAGIEGKTPFYVHALVQKSYIDSAFKLEGGSSQIAKALWKQLQKYGGEIVRNEQVIRLDEKNGKITNVVTSSGRHFQGNDFILNVHPAVALQWIESEQLKSIYRKRILSLENSISAFMVNIVLIPGKVRYNNHNVYWNKNGNSLNTTNYLPNGWPSNYALYFSEDKTKPGYADTLAILSYMHTSETATWNHTYNRTAKPSDRDEGYQLFKEEKSQQLINKVAERMPDLKKNIVAFQAATPLTFRDYMGTKDGSMYGIAKTVGSATQTQIPVRTKIPNLFFTGQNVNLHGVLGVSVSAVLTTAALIGLETILKKI